MKRVVVISDAQVPYQQERQVSALVRFIKETNPDDVYCVGDVADLPMVSRWERGRKGEYSGLLDHHREEVKKFLRRVMPNGGHLKEGNHDRRLEMYLHSYAPAAAELPEMKMERFFGLSDMGIELHRDLWEYSPGYILAHGDEGTLSRVGGMTAFNLAKELNKSVTCSHTHRQGIIHQGSSLLGVAKDGIWGQEVGHTMAMDAATYLRSGKSNWTAGFGILDILGNGRVVPTNVQMSPTGSFVFEGRSYEDGIIRVKVSTK